MTILVMGLESRTDYEGNVLPNSLLTAMHAGNAAAVAAGQVGGQDTNTLILIHIFAGGQRAVGFSTPRSGVEKPAAGRGPAQRARKVERRHGTVRDKCLSSEPGRAQL